MAPRKNSRAHGFMGRWSYAVLSDPVSRRSAVRRSSSEQLFCLRAEL